MKTLRPLLLAASMLAGACSAPAAFARTIVITPSSDGSLYACDGCNVVSDGDYVLVSDYIQGAIKFPTKRYANATTIKKAVLSINAYGLPLWDLTVDVYGYGTTQGQLVEADANAGTYIGTLTIPADAGYGQPIYFDVTEFIRQTRARYVAFNLRTDAGTDVFSSLEYNYGQPSQLIVRTGSTAP